MGILRPRIFASDYAIESSANEFPRNAKRLSMKIFVVTGLSGSGKSIALNALEDEGFYCIDNLPVGLLLTVLRRLTERPVSQEIAVGVDVRSGFEDLHNFGEVIEELRGRGHDITVMFLQAREAVLIKRYGETRRKHPLTHDGLPLVEAIREEKRILSEVAGFADLQIDTSQYSIHELSLLVRDRVSPGESENKLSILIQSFGFKNGLPLDSDYVFDVRCLPNPYWDVKLRSFSGLDQPVIDYLSQYPQVEEMYETLSDFLISWMPSLQQSNRSYVTVSVGCTGGRHRSVYMAQKLGDKLAEHFGDAVKIRHRDL